jgi:hypothetical protein
MAATITTMNSRQRATATAADYAALAEQMHRVELEDLLIAHSRVRADLADRRLAASDAATTGMIAEDERLLSAVALTPPRDLRDIRWKLELYSQSFCEDGFPTKASTMLIAAIHADLRFLERRA